MTRGLWGYGKSPAGAMIIQKFHSYDENNLIRRLQEMSWTLVSDNAGLGGGRE
jgi:hypothetical protein